MPKSYNTFIDIFELISAQFSFLK